MRLNVIDTQPTNAAVMVSQGWAAMSKTCLIGTANLFNCLGIVIHNRVGNVGVVAHVEAKNSKDYLKDIKGALKEIMAKINDSGGGSGSLSVVLLGNSGANSDFNQSLESAVYEFVAPGYRLKKQDLMDLRRPTCRIGSAAGPKGPFRATCSIPKKGRSGLAPF